MAKRDRGMLCPTVAPAPIPPLRAVAPAARREATAAHRGETLALLAALAFIALVMVGATRAPLSFSLIAVALLAGPHNWFELRYFLTHMPAHWGPQRAWFVVALSGVALLSGANGAISWLGTRFADSETFWRICEAGWTSGLVLWVALLAHLRGARRALPIALAAIVAVCAVPLPWDVLLVYLHPLVALAFLERELRRRPVLHRALCAVLCALPALAAVVWWNATDAVPTLSDAWFDRVAGVAGAWVVRAGPPQKMVAVYVLLQMLHYGAWIVALPLLRLREAPWRLRKVPLMRRFPHLTVALVLASGTAVIVLWGGFWRAPALTWDIYFQLAIVHVLIEFPFLIRKYALEPSRSRATSQT